jgi:hypothetical protein
LPVNPSGNVVLRLCAPARFECWQHRQIDRLRARSDPKTATESRTQMRLGLPWRAPRRSLGSHQAAQRRSCSHPLRVRALRGGHRGEREACLISREHISREWRKVEP